MKFIGYNLLIVLAFGLILEGLFLLMLENPTLIPDAWLMPFKHYYLDEDRDILQYQEGVAVHDRELFYKLKPGEHRFANREFDVSVKVNSFGLRDDEESLEGPQIILLGDSQGMGWGVEEGQTMADLIEAGSGRKVLNAALTSYGTAREMMLLEQLDLEQVELIILQYAANDYKENAYYASGNFEISGPNVFEAICSTHNSKITYYPFKHSLRLFGQLGRHIGSSDPAKNELPDPLMEEEVDHFIRCMQELYPANYRGRFLIFNVNAHRTSSKFIDGFEQAMDRINPEWRRVGQIRVLRTVEFLDESHYHRLDDHLNAKGHKALAQKILEFL